MIPRRQDLLGQLQHQGDPGRQPERHGDALDPVHRPGRERPERSSDRPREQQDLLDEPVLRRGSGREPGRLGHRPTLFGGEAETTRSGSRSTPRPARSTGPTSTPARSGSGPWGAAPWAAAQTLFNSSTPSGPAIDPTTNKIYWTSWTSGLGIRVGNLRRHRHGLDPVRRRGRIALRRAAEGACEHRASDDLRRSQGGEGTHLPERDVGARLARRRSCSGPRPASPISGRRMGRTSPPVRRSRPTWPATTPAP